MSYSLTFNSVLLDDAGKWHHNRSLARLWTDAVMRGQSLLLPAAEGRRAYAPILDEITFDLELVVRGNKDHSGTNHPNLVTGVNANLLYLGMNVGSIGGTHTATFVHGSASYTAQAQILNWKLARHEGTVAFVSYDLRVPAGAFELVP